MVFNKDGALIYVPTHDFWTPAILADAKVRELAMSMVPSTKAYASLLAPHYLVNGITNDWDVDITVSMTRDDKDMLPGVGLTFPPAPGGKMIHMCLTLRDAQLWTESSKKQGKDEKFNTMPVCILAEYVEECQAGEAFHQVDAVLASLESQWMLRMANGCLDHEHYSAYSGSTYKKGTFRPSRLIFQDATFAQLARSHRAGTKFDVDEIYFAHPASKANSSRLYNSRHKHGPDTSQSKGIKNPDECHLHSKGQPLVVCGNPECYSVGVSEAGKVDLKLLKRCSRCTVVY